MKKNQHVVPHSEGWAVKGAGNVKATVVYPTQKQAITRAEEIAKHQKTDTKIHGWMARLEPEIVMVMTLVRRKTISSI